MRKISGHARLRMQQRGMSAADVDFILQYGSEVPGGFMLADKDVAEVDAEMHGIATQAHKLRGRLVAISEGTVKTVFKASERQQSRLLR